MSAKRKCVIYGLVFIAAWFHASRLNAQIEILDNNPPGLDWFQINTDHFKIIFEDRFEKEAQRAASTLEYLYAPVSKTLDGNPRKISVILQNQNVISNGFVSQSPRRSEFMTMPTQDYNFIGVTDWIDLLAIHEFRHVVQFDKSITGFNKALFYLFGYEVSSSMSHLAVPDWFWEGDAVVIETALSNGGRGRIPNFGLLFRTNTLERGTFSYHKQYLRSYKHNVQNHYVTGYYFSTFLRRKYSSQVISRVTTETWAWPFIPFRFSNRLKKYTGKNLIENYHEMMDELDTIWRLQNENRDHTVFRQVNFRLRKAYTDYLYPQYSSSGKIVTLKRGIGDFSTFVVFNENGIEEKVFIPGILNESGIMSMEKDILVWNEYEFDPRYRNRTYSVIKSYDLNTGEHNRITYKSRFSSASLSPDGLKIVATEVSESGENSAVVIDRITGQKLYNLPNPGNFLISTPNWSNDGRRIIGVKHGREGKTIWMYDIDEERLIDLWPLNFENVGAPVMFEHYIYYSSPYDGIDNIYVFDLYTGERFRVTNSQYGAYNPEISEDGNTLLYNDFGRDGMNVVSIPLQPAFWTPVDEVEIFREAYYEPIIEQEGNVNIGNLADSTRHDAIPYRLGSRVINPYGWGPYIESTDLDFTIGIRSQDIMSTTYLDAGYKLNANENTGEWYGTISYQGLFPLINITGFSGNRKSSDRFVFLNDSTQNIELDTIVDLNWRERGIKSGLYIPLTLTRSKNIENLNIGFDLSYAKVSDYNFFASYPDKLANGNLFYNAYSLYYRRSLKVSKRDLNTRFGQSIYLNYTHTPYGGDYVGAMFATELRLFFPGLFKHHSIQLRSSFTKHDLDKGYFGVGLEFPKSYIFRSPVMMTRGYSARIFENYWNNSLNYALPLMYPDIHFGSLLNIQRVYTNLFFDYGIRRSISDRTDYFRSMGAEVMFDFNVMRFLTLFNMGFRYTYAMDAQVDPHSFQLLLGNFGF